jgi:hypothetical protein
VAAASLLNNGGYGGGGGVSNGLAMKMAGVSGVISGSAGGSGEKRKAAASMATENKRGEK